MNASQARQRISITYVLLTAFARSLFATPQANRVWCDVQVEEFQTVDIGLAVDPERGLVAPLLRDVGAAPLDSIAAGAKRLVERAKNGELNDHGCTRRRNHSVQCWHASSQISYSLINPGQAAILGVGSVQHVFRPRPGGEPVPRQEIGLVLACDHRTWDRVAAAAFLNRVADNLARPLVLIRPIIGSE